MENSICKWHLEIHGNLDQSRLKFINWNWKMANGTANGRVLIFKSTAHSYVLMNVNEKKIPGEDN